MLEELAGAKPTILVLEDMHWSDEATLDVLRLLARRVEELDRTRPHQTTATTRSSLAPGDRRARVEPRRPAARRIHPLSRAAVALLAEPYGVDAGELHRMTVGKPVLRHRGAGRRRSLIPESVRDAVLARAARLCPSARTSSRRCRRCLRGGALAPGRTRRTDRLRPRRVSHVGTPASTADASDLSARARPARDRGVAESRARSLLHRRCSQRSRRRTGPVDVARLAYHAEAAGDPESRPPLRARGGRAASTLGAHREAAGQYCQGCVPATRLRDSDHATTSSSGSRSSCYLTSE